MSDTPGIFTADPAIVAGITLREGRDGPAYLDNSYGFLHGFLSPEEELRIRPEVLERRAALARRLSPTATASFGRQTHGSTVILAPQGGSTAGDTEADALVTNQPDNLLGVVLADCAGVLLADPTARVIAAVHSGWRGTRANIVEAAIGKMVELGAKPQRILAYISPVACPRHYEVGDEFGNYFDAAFLPYLNGKRSFDNAAALAAQLHRAGVTQLQQDPRCSVEDSFLHSARRDGQTAGRMVAYIGLRK